MPNCKFVVDKKLCFILWTLALIDQDDNFLSKNDLFPIDQLSKEERNILRKIKIINKRAVADILEKREKSYWIDFRLLGTIGKNRSVLNKTQAVLVRDSYKILGSKFNKFWSKEYPKLKYWKDRLDSFNFKKIYPIIKLSRSFLGGEIAPEYVISLIPSLRSDIPLAWSSYLRPNFIVIGVSGLSKNNFQSIITYIFHEIGHHISFLASNHYGLIADSVCKNSSKIISSLNLDNKYGLPRLEYVVDDIIIHSLACYLPKYLNIKIAMNAEEFISDIKKMPFGTAIENDSNIVWLVVGKMEKTLFGYLSKNKSLDKKYISEIIKNIITIFKLKRF